MGLDLRVELPRPANASKKRKASIDVLGRMRMGYMLVNKMKMYLADLTVAHAKRTAANPPSPQQPPADAKEPATTASSLPAPAAAPAAASSSSSSSKHNDVDDDDGYGGRSEGPQHVLARSSAAKLAVAAAPAKSAAKPVVAPKTTPPPKAKDAAAKQWKAAAVAVKLWRDAFYQMLMNPMGMSVRFDFETGKMVKIKPVPAYDPKAIAAVRLSGFLIYANTPDTDPVWSSEQASAVVVWMKLIYEDAVSAYAKTKDAVVPAERCTTTGVHEWPDKHPDMISVFGELYKLFITCANSPGSKIIGS
jgi:hypothetical protein